MRKEEKNPHQFDALGDSLRRKGQESGLKAPTFVVK